MEPTNRERATWARTALKSFTRDTKCDYEDGIGDLLCDLMHFANLYGFDFETELTRARRHYRSETSIDQP